MRTKEGTTKHTTEYYRGHKIYQFGRTWYGQGDSVMTVQAPTKRALLKKLDERHQAFLTVNDIIK